MLGKKMNMPGEYVLQEAWPFFAGSGRSSLSCLTIENAEAPFGIYLDALDKFNTACVSLAVTEWLETSKQ